MSILLVRLYEIGITDVKQIREIADLVFVNYHTDSKAILMMSDEDLDRAIHQIAGGK
jgi:hypothetical protein